MVCGRTYHSTVCLLAILCDLRLGVVRPGFGVGAVEGLGTLFQLELILKVREVVIHCLTDVECLDT